MDDVEAIVTYWCDATEEHLLSMGVDLAKQPAHEEVRNMLYGMMATPIPERKSFPIIWEVDGVAVGHNNINAIVPGDHAFMHLHLWRTDLRHRGLGAQLIRMSLPHFFRHYDLQRLYCQPYARNDAPNRALEKAGFTYVKEYVTVPGPMNFEQPVKLWVMERVNVEGL